MLYSGSVYRCPIQAGLEDEIFIQLFHITLPPPPRSTPCFLSTSYYCTCRQEGVHKYFTAPAPVTLPCHPSGQAGYQQEWVLCERTEGLTVGQQGNHQEWVPHRMRNSLWSSQAITKNEYFTDWGTISL